MAPIRCCRWLHHLIPPLAPSMIPPSSLSLERPAPAGRSFFLLFPSFHFPFSACSFSSLAPYCALLSPSSYSRKSLIFGELYCSLATDIICVFLPSPLSRIGRVGERLQFFSIYDYPASLLLCPLLVSYHRMDDAKRLSSGPLLLQS